jgi:hypothetical protein
VAGYAAETRFVVVDLSDAERGGRIVDATEREVARLLPGARPIDDTAMRHLMATGEGPAEIAVRWNEEARARRAAGDCRGAIDQARRAETLTLSSVPLDEERDLLRSLYVVMVACAEALGDSTVRDSAAFRLRALGSLPPPDLSREIWDKHVSAVAEGPPATELRVDSVPPNARVFVNFHGAGVTPQTIKVPLGTAYVEVEKSGFRKEFRRWEITGQPTQTVLTLISHSRDRHAQAHRLHRVLRAAGDTEGWRGSLARLAQLVRADLLVLLEAHGTQVRIWFFDTEKGEVLPDVIDSPWDSATGRVAALVAQTSLLIPLPRGSGDKGGQLPVTRARVGPKPAPWWSWAIAGAIGASLGVFIYLDQ